MMRARRWIPVFLVSLVLAVTGCSGSQTSGEPDPDSPLGLTERATQAYLTGQPEQAIDLCRRALAAKPDSPRAQLLLGMAFRLAADRASGPERDALRREELAALTKAAELDPKNLAARVDLASSLLQAGQDQRAAEQLRQAAELTPGEPWTKTLSPLAEHDAPAPTQAGAQPPAPQPGADVDQPQEP